ncbi:MAG TPA: response regulator transcription factor [Intrasporangium sp.]|nr:response regulator transcription factor [Intrasporangium sp.]
MRVVIAEDLVLLRDGIARALSAHGVEVVACVGDAGALLESVAALRPDAALIDVRMPPTFTDEGARATLLLRERFPDTGALVLSHTIDPQLALHLAGQQPRGFGYLLKDRVIDVPAFVDAVRAVAAGGTVIDPAVIEEGLAARRTPLAQLTARELDVLRELAGGRSNAAIATALFLSERTVEAHLRSIFLKLELPPDTDSNRRVRAALAWLAERP